MSTVCFVLNTRIPLPTPVLRMIVSTERRVRSLHSRIVVRATTDTTDQRRQLIQFYSLTKHNLQTTHNPAGATARTAIRLARATQSPLRTPAGNRLQTSSARVQDFLLNISYSRVNTHSHTVFRLPRQPSTACLLGWTESYTTVSLKQAFPRLPYSSYTTSLPLLYSHS